MAYGKFKVDWKNFFLGFGVMALCLIIPGVSGVFSSLIEKIRGVMPFGKGE